MRGKIPYLERPVQQPSPHHGQNEPYRAPLPAAAFGPMRPTTRWIYAAITAVMGLCFVTAVTTLTVAIIGAESHPRHQPNNALMSIGIPAFIVMMLFVYGQIAAGLVWLYKAWSWLPWDQRYTRHWRSWLQPGQVALMMLIPYFHYYWMFVANCGLCDALDRLRVSYPTRDAAPKNLAIAACVCQLLIPFPVGTVLWLIFMTRVERMTREMSAAMEPRAHNAF